MRVIHYIFIFLLLSFPLCGEGFASGTLVRTLSGYIPIEHLHINDLVVTYDFANHSFVGQKITAIHSQEYSTYIQLTLDNHSICVAPDQQLYNPITQQWVRAYHITPSDVLLCNSDCYFCIQAVEQIQQKRIFYAITVAEHHNFCIDALNIHVHNFVHVVLSAAPSVVSSIFSWGTAAVVAPPLGAIIIAKVFSFFTSKKKKETASFAGPQIYTGSGSPLLPPEDPDQNRHIIKVNNMQEFFETLFGKELKPYLEKTKQIKQGQSVYKVTRNMPKYNLKKGNLLYLDNLHKDHLEVFNNKGLSKNVLNLDGTKKCH